MPETIRELSAQVADLRTDIVELSAQTKMLNQLLTGNGTPEQGVIVRLDRIEQNQQRTSWFGRTLVASIIGGIGGYLTSLFFHK